MRTSTGLILRRNCKNDVGKVVIVIPIYVLDIKDVELGWRMSTTPPSSGARWPCRGSTPLMFLMGT
jgi:hypothetical protein